jgi:hypothetical protein
MPGRGRGRLNRFAENRGARRDEVLASLAADQVRPAHRDIRHLIEPTNSSRTFRTAFSRGKAPCDIRIDLMVKVKTQFVVNLPLN